MPMNTLARLRKPQAAVIAVTIAAGVIGGVLYANYASTSPLASAGNSVSPADPQVEQIYHLDDESHVFAMHWRGNDELWFVASAPDGTLALNRYTMSSKAKASWPVPVKANQTIYTFLVEDRGGLLWVGANYTLAAFDPGSASFVFAQELDPQPAELDPGAAAAGYFDGSWITGMISDPAGSIVLARHNTNALFGVETDGISLLRRLERPPTGLRLVGGEVQGIARENDNVAIIGTQQVEPLRSLGDSGCSLVEGAPGEGATLVAGGVEIASGLLIAPEDPIVVDAKAQRVLLGVANAGALVLADCLDGSASAFMLGSELAYVDGIVGGKDFSEPIENLYFAEAVALSPSGGVAASVSNHEVVVIR
jgi:hypothetical protein